jgi:hypothetical protein
MSHCTATNEEKKGDATRNAPRKEFFDKAWVLPDVERMAQ